MPARNPTPRRAPGGAGAPSGARKGPPPRPVPTASSARTVAPRSSSQSPSRQPRGGHPATAPNGESIDPSPTRRRSSRTASRGRPCGSRLARLAGERPPRRYDRDDLDVEGRAATPASSTPRGCRPRRDVLTSPLDPRPLDDPRLPRRRDRVTRAAGSSRPPVATTVTATRDAAQRSFSSARAQPRPDRRDEREPRRSPSEPSTAARRPI